MKNIKIHILFSLLIDWFLLSAGVFFSVVSILAADVYRSIVAVLVSVILLCDTFIKTFVWGRIVFCVIFSKPTTIITKGYRYSEGCTVYFPVDSRFGRSNKFYYSKIYFDDKRFKRNCGYIFLENRLFRNGNPLEVIYYPRVKYIKSIRKLTDVNVDAS